MEKWTLETISWVTFSGWWVFVWFGFPLPGQTVKKVDLTFVSVLLFLLGIFFYFVLLWWCLCSWMTRYNSHLLCVSISSSAYSTDYFTPLLGCPIYTSHTACPKRGSWLLQIPHNFGFHSPAVSVDENTILPVAQAKIPQSYSFFLLLLLTINLLANPIGSVATVCPLLTIYCHCRPSPSTPLSSLSLFSAVTS